MIVPSGLKLQWEDEFRKWMPSMAKHINVIHNNSGNVSGIINIISYGMVATFYELILERNFQVIICDESHSLKSPTTERTKLVVPLLRAANRRILLSGTPALSRPEELYSQLCALDAQIFSNMHDFGLRYCAAHMGKEKEEGKEEGKKRGTRRVIMSFFTKKRRKGGCRGRRRKRGTRRVILRVKYTFFTEKKEKRRE